MYKTLDRRRCHASSSRRTPSAEHYIILVYYYGNGLLRFYRHPPYRHLDVRIYYVHNITSKQNANVHCNERFTGYYYIKNIILILYRLEHGRSRYYFIFNYYFCVQ